MDLTLLNSLIQGGFAALFIWLFYDTRKESKEREKESKDREAKLLQVISENREERAKLVAIIDNFQERFRTIGETLQKITDHLDNKR